MENFLTYLISPLLSDPAGLTISQNSSTVTVKVSDADTGRIIGKHGAVINALRTLTKTYCAKNHLPQVTIVLDSPPKKD